MPPLSRLGSLGQQRATPRSCPRGRAPWRTAGRAPDRIPVPRGRRSTSDRIHALRPLLGAEDRLPPCVAALADALAEAPPASRTARRPPPQAAATTPTTATRTADLTRKRNRIPFPSLPRRRTTPRASPRQPIHMSPPPQSRRSTDYDTRFAEAELGPSATVQSASAAARPAAEGSPTPAMVPRDPRAAARSPNASLGVRRARPGPDDQQRDRVGRVGLADAGGRVVGGHGHERPVRVDPGQQLPEERRVDVLDDLPLVLGPAVVGGDVGPLDVDVQGVVAAQGLGGQLGPGRYCSRRGRPVGASTGPCPGPSRSPARRASPRSIPTTGPNRSLIGWSRGTWSPPSRVRIRLAGEPPLGPAPAR